MEEASVARDEAAQSRTRALLSEHLFRPTTIHSIELHGAKSTRRSFLDPVFGPLVEESRNAGTTMGDVLDGLAQVTRKLDAFDIFRPGPEVFISDARASSPAAAASDIDVAFRVHERGRLSFHAGTEVGDSEGGAYTNAMVRNLFGGAESLSVNASAGTRTRSAYKVTFATPVNSNPDLRLRIDALASATQKPWASHEEAVKGGAATLQWASEVGDTHSLAYTGAWRQITGLAAHASPTVRGDAGDSVKSALSHSFKRDRRDNAHLPQRGYLFRTVSELAGWGPLGGDVAFAKTEVELSGALPVPLPGAPRGVSVGASFRAGLLYPLPLGGYGPRGARASPSRINDRFQLGGPTDVRGFKLGGLGPHDGPDAAGGDVFAAAGVNVLLPLPRAGPDSPLRLQLFANGGRLVASATQAKHKDHTTDAWQGVKEAVGELGNGFPSVAAGVGLVYACPGVARFELNFSLPIVARRGEHLRKGFQVGCGIDFL